MAGSWTERGRTRVRAGGMILLAYLFLLQALLAPGAALSARDAPSGPGMALCAAAMVDGVDATGAGPPDGSHAPCCALGCLPSMAGLAAPALTGSSPAPALPRDRLATASAWPVTEPSGPPRPWRPNSAGPRAPPLWVA